MKLGQVLRNHSNVLKLQFRFSNQCFCFIICLGFELLCVMSRRLGGSGKYVHNYFSHKQITEFFQQPVVLTLNLPASGCSVAPLQSQLMPRSVGRLPSLSFSYFLLLLLGDQQRFDVLCFHVLVAELVTQTSGAGQTCRVSHSCIEAA